MLVTRFVTSAVTCVAWASLTACAAAPDEGAAPTSSGATASSAPASSETGAGGSPSPPTDAEDDVRTIEIKVTGSDVEPRPGQIDLAEGAAMRILVTVDSDSEVHTHGLGDLSVPVTAGEPAVVDLVGGAPGVYEIELHDPDLLLTQIAVR